MNPSTRERLRKGWGFCERHAWGWMAVEAAFRGGYVHGPAVVYEELIGLALASFEVHGPVQFGRLKRRLREKGPCLMCEEGYDAVSEGFIKEERVERGRDPRELRRLARRTQPYWQHTVCGKCTGTTSEQLCRPHLIEHESQVLTEDISAHRSLVNYVARHLARYTLSFQFEFRGTETGEDAAALISAVGWCSGWSLFFSIMGEMNSEPGDKVGANGIQPYEERIL